MHSGHVEFFRQASQYGDLYVGIGSDKTILHYKNHKTVYSEQERLFMVKSIRYVKDAYINAGDGILDFLPTLDIVQPDILVVNSDGGSDAKRKVCEERGMEYVVLERDPHEGLAARSSTDLKKSPCQIPVRLDLAGTWIDQPYVSCHASGWALTISLEPSFEIRERCGLSTSTRNVIKKFWPYQLPNMEPEMLARLVFCLENHPERESGIISGAQDSIGICVPGLCRHYYDNHFWPERIETCEEEAVLQWLENHLCMIPMEPRSPGCSVVEGQDITPEKVKALAAAAEQSFNTSAYGGFGKLNLTDVLCGDIYLLAEIIALCVLHAACLINYLVAEQSGYSVDNSASADAFAFTFAKNMEAEVGIDSVDGAVFGGGAALGFSAFKSGTCCCCAD